MRLCISIRGSVRLMVGPFVGPFIGLSLLHLKDKYGHILRVKKLSKGNIKNDIMFHVYFFDICYFVVDA